MALPLLTTRRNFDRYMGSANRGQRVFNYTFLFSLPIGVIHLFLVLNFCWSSPSINPAPRVRVDPQGPFTKTPSYPSSETYDGTQEQTDNNGRIYTNIFQKISGEGWQVWHDNDTPLYPPSDDTNLACHWARFRPKRQYPNLDDVNTRMLREQEQPPVQICLHDAKSDQYVSRKIRERGHWEDCDSLTYYWYTTNNLHQQSTDDDDDETSSQQWFLDIGANIGACVLQVLLTTSANIMAFEPEPTNLFHLTSTISRLEPALRKRVYVFPIGLGNATQKAPIHVAADNRGNAAIGQPIPDRHQQDQVFLPPNMVPVERLDDILMKQHKIRLAKMDAQGYECRILEGAQTTILQETSALVFELERTMLRASDDCSEQMLWDIIVQESSWEVYRDDLLRNGVAPASARASRKTVYADGVNLVAVNERMRKNNKNEPETAR
ncbi:expressed unknown protein [Seminavis robusta]|uniref:Methyltransferase FkbM domain-containing protein n=1 Tax=Seminavis robusta TaxID=568900 RepID=A0A9N8E8P5_9STRA|nr:expressed unknown protein [Seminavis robusta]|eukprot:Sro807_g205250.1 n/a (437) ;mRNA; r:26119-27429